MRALSWLAVAVIVGGASTYSSPAKAYYSDDHVWDREYQSGSEWRVARPAQPVPWVASSAWHRVVPDAAGAWWQAATPVAPGYIPISPEWMRTANGQHPWERMAWNVPWWNPSSPLLTNQGYHQAVFDSRRNPYSNQRLNADLGSAAAHGDVRLVQALMSHGADHNARDAEGFTALTWAAQFGRYEVVDYLSARHSHVNVIDRWGYTPLMWALQQGHVAVAALLLSRGANPAVSTPFGITPRVLAIHAAGGSARSLVEEALAGRPIRVEAYGGAPTVPSPQGVQPVPAQSPAPPAGWSWNGQAWVQSAAQPSAPVQPVWLSGQRAEQPTVARATGVLEPEPLVLSSLSTYSSTHADGLGPLAPLPLAERQGRGATVGRFKKMEPEAGWQRVSAIAGYFGNAYQQFVLEKHQKKDGNQGAVREADPDEWMGTAMGRVFGRALQTRNPVKARRDVERVKRSISVHTRFLPYLTALDETLLAMGH